MSDLKPCPFCGKKTPFAIGGNDSDLVKCGGCPSGIMTEEHWNTRPIEDALRAEVERLRKLIRCEQTEPPFDVTDDMTTEFAVEIAQLKSDVERLTKELDNIMRVLPVGNVNSHTPENAVHIIKDYLQELAKESLQNEDLQNKLERMESELESVKADNAELNRTIEQLGDDIQAQRRRIAELEAEVNRTNPPKRKVEIRWA